MQGRLSIDPRWKSIHQDGTDFPGETHPAMMALKTRNRVKNVIMGVFNPSNNKYTWININSAPQFIRNESSPYQVITIFEDITENIIAQNTIKESGKKLKASNETKDKFFSIISHDLRNPFQNILGLSDLLSKDYDSIDDNHRKRIINGINNSAKLTYSLLENLLTWSGSQRGRIKINREVLQLKSLCDQSIGPYLAYACEKGLVVKNNIHEDISVMADKYTIEIVLGNLVNNAIKFTASGGVYITSSTNNDNVEISISDTGVGINDDMLDKIFQIDRFVSTRGTNNETGTGLGLILCKEFIAKNNGTINVSSKPGKETTFIITLPVN